MKKLLKEQLELKQARSAAKKYNLDFKHTCVFDHQVRHISGLKNGTGEIVKIPMESGKVGLYKVTSEPYSVMGNTGQRNWYFKFQGYSE